MNSKLTNVLRIALKLGEITNQRIRSLMKIQIKLLQLGIYFLPPWSLIISLSEVNMSI